MDWAQLALLSGLQNYYKFLTYANFLEKKSHFYAFFLITAFFRKTANTTTLIAIDLI